MGTDWPFADPEETEVIVLERILQGLTPLLVVTHDEEDGSWQFLDGEHVFEDDGIAVRLGEMVQFDASIAALADLPTGWHAWRANPADPWNRAEGEPPDSLSSRPDWVF